MSSFNFPIPPINHKDLQRYVRSGLNSTEARLYWWPLLVKIGHREGFNEQFDVKEQAKRRYIWIKKSMSSIPSTTSSNHKNKSKNNDNNNNNHHNNSNEEPIEVNLEFNEDPQTVVSNILPLLMQQFDMKEPAIIMPLIRTLSTVLTNSAICFSTCCDILERPGWFAAPDPANYRLRLALFRELIRLSVPKASTVLEEIGALSDHFLSIIFVDLFDGILSTQEKYRIIDVYLLEGVKTLYRFGIGLLKLYKSRVKGHEYSSSESFWNGLKTQRQFTIDELVATSLDMNIGFFERKTVPSRATMLTLEENIRASNALSSAPLNLRLPSEIRIAGNNGFTFVSGGILTSQSRLLDDESCAILNSFIPPHSRLEGFDLMYATYNDGWSLEQLYGMTTNLSPCILLVKSANKNALVGMYLTCNISPASHDIRGDGQCFVFRLNGELAGKYEWSSPNEHHQLNHSASPTSATWNQFALCSPSYLAFGGSEKHGTNALRLDNDLSHCSCGHSDTFGNPPLTPEESRQPFPVLEIEIFCGHSTVSRSGLPVSVPRKETNSKR